MMSTPALLAAAQEAAKGSSEQAAAASAFSGERSMQRYHSLEHPPLNSSHQNHLAPNTADQLSLRRASAPLPPSVGAATGSSTHRRAGRSKAAKADQPLRTEWQRQDEARKERNREAAAASRQRRLERQAALEQRVAELEEENERLTALLAAHGIADGSSSRPGTGQPAQASAEPPEPVAAATLQVPSCPASLVCQAAVFAALTRETSLPLGSTPATSPAPMPCQARAPATAAALQASALAVSAAAASAASELAFDLGLGGLLAPAQAPPTAAASQGSAPTSCNDVPTCSTLSSPPRPPTAQRARSFRSSTEIALSNRDAAAFIAFISSTLRSNQAAFPLLRGELALLLASDDADDIGGFVLQCIEEGLCSPDISPAICHLILDTAIGLEQWPPSGSLTTRKAATAVLLQCCRDQPRLAVKVAQCWGLEVDDFSVKHQVELLDHISRLLDANATSASGVSLLLHFRPLLPHFHLEAVLEDLVLSSQEPVATRLVRQLGDREMQSLLVSHCLTYAQLRSANNVVREFGLQQEFPDVERMHRSKQLSKMAEKGLWGVAAQYVGEDGELQRKLLLAMLAAGELSLAAQHQQQFGLQEEFVIDPRQLAVEQARRREQYLAMPLPPEALHYVDSAEGLLHMGRRLQLLLHQPARHGGAHTPIDGEPSAAVGAAVGVTPAASAAEAAAAVAASASGASQGCSEDGASERDAALLPVLGLDLEWQPDNGSSSPPSVLQISTDSEVFVVDLLALRERNQADLLTAALAPALTSTLVFKVGCGLASDFKRLAGHHPDTFSLAHSCLDLSTLWRLRYIEQTGKRSTAGFKRRAGEVSLSQLAQSVLGKPLDKACQCSSWGLRPLSEAQLLYAALDALSAVLIFRGMGQLHHPFQTRQGLLHHAFTYDARHPGANNGGSGGTGGGGGGSDSPPDGGAPGARAVAASDGMAAGGANCRQQHGSSGAGDSSEAGSRHVAAAWGSGAVHARQQQSFMRRTCAGLGSFQPAPPPVWGGVRSLLASVAVAPSPACRAFPCWRWRASLRRILPCRAMAAIPLPGLL